MRSPMRPTSSSSRRSPHSTTNSSPPRRATVSACRDRSESLRPTSASTWSPASCPNESLIFLKWSKSTNRTARRPGCRSKRCKSLGKPVHQGGPVREPGHRVVQDLVSESLLRLDLCRHVAGNAERADDLAALVAKRHLRGRNPGTGSVVECLPLQLPHNRLAGADDLLLVLKSSSSVFLAEEVEVSLPDDLLQGAVGSDRGHPACADQEEPAAHVLEVHALLGAVQQVAHAGAFDPAQLLALLRPTSAQPPLDHCNSRSGIDEYYSPTLQVPPRPP